MNMSKDITDIANWKEEYPFLDAVWKFYNKFDIITVEDTYDHYIHPSCFMILNKNGMNIGAYNSFCTKLLKNLGHYSENTKSYIRSHDHCNILYNWIYNSKKKYTIPDEIINDCFEEYTRIGNVMSYDYKCSYDTYNGLYEEPIKITLLDIFDNNTPIIKTALMNPDEKISTSSRKYVCECVKIYKQMNDIYCLKREEGNEKHTNTCSRLERFKLTYTWFIQDIQDIKDKIPSLDDIKNTYMPKCQKYVQEEPLQPLGDEEQRTHSLLSKPKDKNTPGTKSLIQPDDENQDGFMSPTVSTAISTVAGASSFLALLYKFTPAKKWIYSGLGGSRGRMHSNFNVDRERELLFDGLAHDNLNSYNIGYEAAYDP